jgi:hypothetical protein
LLHDERSESFIQSKIRALRISAIGRDRQAIEHSRMGSFHHPIGCWGLPGAA